MEGNCKRPIDIRLVFLSYKTTVDSNISINRRAIKSIIHVYYRCTPGFEHECYGMEP